MELQSGVASVFFLQGFSNLSDSSPAKTCSFSHLSAPPPVRPLSYRISLLLCLAVPVYIPERTPLLSAFCRRSEPYGSQTLPLQYVTYSWLTILSKESWSCTVKCRINLLAFISKVLMTSSQQAQSYVIGSVCTVASSR